MTKEKAYLISTAEKLCIPALEKAINNILTDKAYLVIDHISVECSKLEELLRPLWGIAPLLSKNRYEITVKGEKTELTAALRQIILEGSDENSPICFSRYASNRDEIFFANQMITEFAGYCVAVAIAPEVLWYPYTEEERSQLSAWIKKWAVTALKNSWRNNHFWFPMLAVTALEKIGIDCGDVAADMADGFSVLDTMYISDGWYQDGEFGRFDYYLAWSHHVYPLLWSYLAEGTRFYDAERTAVYKKRTAEFFDYYTHMFDTDGSVPTFGRSLCYRFAQSSYFAAAAFSGCDINLGMARRLIIKNVSYFMDNMILPEDNVVPVGYLYEATGVVENYISAGCPYWFSKTFLALMIEDDHPLWTAEDTLFPAEKGEFLVNASAEGINMLLEYNQNSGVTFFNNTTQFYNKKRGYGGLFNDMASCYSKFAYNSRSGFGLSSADTTSLDNMIGLQTWDVTMTSHRTGFVDEGYENGVLVTSHQPFSNDAGSRIKSWIIPLGDTFHIKAHKVTLSQCYRVIEGGFSVGTYDDGSIIDVTGDYAAYSDGKGKRSKLFTVASVPVKYSVRYHMPGMHLLAPASGYPIYSTDVLEAGEYLFASVFSFTTDEVMTEEPQIAIENGHLTVKYKDKHMTIAMN